MSLWELIRGVFTLGHAPTISQDPEVVTPKPQNPHRRRMEFGGEDDVQEALPLEPTVPLHLEDLQGVLNEDQPGPESRYQTLDPTGGSEQPVRLFCWELRDIRVILKIKGGECRGQRNSNLLW